MGGGTTNVVESNKSEYFFNLYPLPRGGRVKTFMMLKGLRFQTIRHNVFYVKGKCPLFIINCEAPIQSESMYGRLNM